MTDECKKIIEKKLKFYDFVRECFEGEVENEKPRCEKCDYFKEVGVGEAGCTLSFSLFCCVKGGYINFCNGYKERR